MQFSYGDDGLNPNVMEKGDRPVDFARLTVNTCLKHIVSQKRRTMKEIDVSCTHLPHFVACVLLLVVFFFNHFLDRFV